MRRWSVSSFFGFCIPFASRFHLGFAVSLEAYQWIIYQLLQLTSENLKQLASEGVDSFTAKNELQAYYYRPLSITYAELGNY